MPEALPELSANADGQLIVVIHSHDVAVGALLERAAARLMPAVCLDGSALIRIAPRPRSHADAAGWLIRTLPDVVAAYRKQGVRTVLLSYPFARVSDVSAVRRVLTPWLPHGQVWRAALSEAAMRRRLQGPDAEQRLGNWQQLDREQDRAARGGDMGRILDLSDDDIEGAATQIADRMQAPVIVADPDPAWTARFEAAREELARGLGSQARSIHHIGSTSVPGLPAKPIVDIMVEVEDLAAVRTWVGDLAALGYRFADHPQNTDRLFFSRADNGTNINLHFVATSSNELGRHLRFRDRLRTDDALRDRYAALKRRLAEAYPHQRWLYTESKSAFIQQIEGSD